MTVVMKFYEILTIAIAMKREVREGGVNVELNTAQDKDSTT